MHRIDADGFVLDGSKRLFQDQNLPTEPGTVVDDTWANAVQEEIGQVIEEEGTALRASGADDEFADYSSQLNQAITDRIQRLGSNPLTKVGLEAGSSFNEVLYNTSTGLTDKDDPVGSVDIEPGVTFTDQGNRIRLTGKIKKCIVLPWSKGSGPSAGAMASGIDWQGTAYNSGRAEYSYLYGFLLYNPNTKEIDYGIDSSLTAANLLNDANADGFTEYRRITVHPLQKNQHQAGLFWGIASLVPYIGGFIGSVAEKLSIGASTDTISAPMYFIDDTAGADDALVRLNSGSIDLTGYANMDEILADGSLDVTEIYNSNDASLYFSPDPFSCVDSGNFALYLPRTESVTDSISGIFPGLFCLNLSVELQEVVFKAATTFDFTAGEIYISSAYNYNSDNKLQPEAIASKISNQGTSGTSEKQITVPKAITDDDLGGLFILAQNSPGLAEIEYFKWADLFEQ